MPGTDQEYLDYAISDDIMPLRWWDGTWVTPQNRADLAAIRAYHRDQTDRGWDDAQRKAKALLKTFLSHEQRKQLGRDKGFIATAHSGNEYRLWPATGNVESVTRHGQRRYKSARFCLHDDPGHDGKRMPPADMSLAHMLLLLTDEAGFLATANRTDARDQLWNQDYLRRLRETRRVR